MKTYIYKLTLKEELTDINNWNKEDEEIVSKHLAYLTTLKDSGVVLLAGKTEGLDKTTYGIVIFKAKNLVLARDIMNNDPAIINKVMTGYLHEYNIALFNKDFIIS